MHLNYALLLHNYSDGEEDIHKAATHYQTAVKLDPNDTAAYKAYAEFVKVLLFCCFLPYLRSFTEPRA